MPSRDEAKSTILLFDESEAARGGLVNLLTRRDGLDIIGAVGSEQAAADVLAREEPDIVLFDMHHSNARGPSICAALRNLTSSPIVVLASFMTPQRWSELKDVGADEFLLKRVDSAALERDLVRIARDYKRQGRPGGT